MLSALLAMGVLIIYLLISLSCLRGEVSRIKADGFSTVLSHMFDKYVHLEETHNQYDEIERRKRIREGFRKSELDNNIYQVLDRQIRLNAIFCSLDREITIKEALQMLFSYLKLKIKLGDDAKIVKIK